MNILVCYFDFIPFFYQLQKVLKLTIKIIKYIILKISNI